MIGRLANDDFCGRENVWQCFNRLHNCGIASIMHDWADAMSDEIKYTLRRGFAIQFCKIGNHSAADRGLRERSFKGNSKAYFENQLEFVSEKFGKYAPTEKLARQDYMCSGFIVACFCTIGIIGATAQVVFPVHVMSPANLYSDPTFGWFRGYLIPKEKDVPPDDPLVGATVLREIRKTDLMDSYPRLKAYYVRAFARPAWQRTLKLYSDRLGVAVADIS
jgi:hypothetical protein